MSSAGYLLWKLVDTLPQTTMALVWIVEAFFRADPDSETPPTRRREKLRQVVLPRHCRMEQLATTEASEFQASAVNVQHGKWASPPLDCPQGAPTHGESVGRSPPGAVPGQLAGGRQHPRRKMSRQAQTSHRQNLITARQSPPGSKYSGR